MKINKNDVNSISFVGYGVYGLGYDSWFESKIFFDINLKNGNFNLTPDNEEHKKYPQTGKCGTIPAGNYAKMNDTGLKVEQSDGI